jgi:class 3 adenylate cyclase
MTSPVAAIAFLDRQRPVGPVHRAIMAVDLEGSTQRTDLVKGELRRVMYDLLAHSLEAVAITGDRVERLIDRGDGVLVLIRPHDDVPKTILLDRLIPLLAALLGEYNARAAEPALRIRLRVVVHAGEINEDDRGFYGEAIDVAIRLLDSRTVKRTLKQATEPLVLVVSDEIYSKIVCHGYVPAATYQPRVRVQVANRWQRGWVHIPAAAAAPDIGHQRWAFGQRTQQAHPRFRSSAIGPKRTARSGHG